ncbi:MAG: hypothetical protein M3322_04260 [Actinomycetota bacterium]|nr:hypothetical protein [Actinomycetota bacterium]
MPASARARAARPVLSRSHDARGVPAARSKGRAHCHFEGTVRPQTFADLARKHGVELPTQEADRLYDYDSIYEFLKIFAMVSATLRDQEDFARAAYESIEDGVKLGNLGVKSRRTTGRFHEVLRVHRS